MKSLFIRGIFVTGAMLFFLSPFSPPPTPEQPIKFSHRIHAGENQIPCMYCHIYARRSQFAGVPSVKICMGCHQIIAADKPDVQKIHKAWDEKRAIEWIKVYDLPDFIYFSHMRHIKKDIECHECHGDVKRMDIMERFSSPEMGWCIECHTRLDAGKDCPVCHK